MRESIAAKLLIQKDVRFRTQWDSTLVSAAVRVQVFTSWLSFLPVNRQIGESFSSYRPGCNSSACAGAAAGRRRN